MFVSVPAVISLHGHHRYYGPDQHLFLQHVKKIPGRHPVAFVSVSRFIQQVYDQFFTSQVIYNGVNFSPYRLQTKKEAYCAFLGRIEPLKGLDFAIDFCERNKILLKIAGGINDEYYFEHQVRPHLDGGLVEYVGPLDERQKNIFLGKARCLLMPTRYEEAFGRVIVEAMACGTPVIAFNKGAVGEIIKHGKTGFLIEEDDFAACLDCFERLSTIDSDLCRKAVEAKFSIERMLDEYEALYKSITI
jgi:glycosyltransferase involved in cell wall biosynthesis